MSSLEQLGSDTEGSIRDKVGGVIGELSAENEDGVGDGPVVANGEGEKAEKEILKPAISGRQVQDDGGGEDDGGAQDNNTDTKGDNKKNGADWNRTELAKERLKKADQVNNEYYQGRPIIGRDAPVDGGVYMGKHQREAIVVDSVKYPEVRRLYEKVLRSINIESASEEEILNAVYSVVSEAMKYDSYGVDRVIAEYSADNDRKIRVDRFIERGIGVCRHQALVCAVILELFQKEGIIKGKVSVDRNTVWGGHAWCRYTDSEGNVIIIDVAQKCFGNLNEVKSKPGTWSYARPEDEENQ